MEHKLNVNLKSLLRVVSEFRIIRNLEKYFFLLIKVSLCCVSFDFPSINNQSEFSFTFGTTIFFSQGEYQMQIFDHPNKKFA